MESEVEAIRAGVAELVEQENVIRQKFKNLLTFMKHSAMKSLITKKNMVQLLTKLTVT